MGRIGVEGETRTLSSAVLTRIFIHLYLRDPTSNRDEMLEPLDGERYAAAAEAVKGQVEALLKKFHAFDPLPSTSDAAEPATPPGGSGEGGITVEGTPLASDGGVQR